LEEQLRAMTAQNELQVEQLTAQLQREQLERSMAEGALESGRRDVARLLREIASMQLKPAAAAAADEAPASGAGGEAPASALRSAA